MAVHTEDEHAQASYLVALLLLAALAMVIINRPTHKEIKDVWTQSREEGSLQSSEKRPKASAIFCDNIESLA